MSDLIKKKNTLLNRTTNKEPKEIFNRDRENLFSEKKIKTKISKLTSSIRVSENTRKSLKALTLVKDFKSVDETLNILINEYTSNLTTDEQKDFRYILDIENRRGRC